LSFKKKSIHLVYKYTKWLTAFVSHRGKKVIQVWNDTRTVTECSFVGELSQ